MDCQIIKRVRKQRLKISIASPSKLNLVAWTLRATAVVEFCLLPYFDYPRLKLKLKSNRWVEFESSSWANQGPELGLAVLEENLPHLVDKSAMVSADWDISQVDQWVMIPSHRNLSSFWEVDHIQRNLYFVCLLVEHFVLKDCVRGFDLIKLIQGIL